MLKKFSMWFWQKDGHIDECKRIEHLEISPYMCDQLIFNQADKTVQ